VYTGDKFSFRSWHQLGFYGMQYSKPRSCLVLVALVLGSKHNKYCVEVLNTAWLETIVLVMVVTPSSPFIERQKGGWGVWFCQSMAWCDRDVIIHDRSHSPYWSSWHDTRYYIANNIGLRHWCQNAEAHLDIHDLLSLHKGTPNYPCSFTLHVTRIIRALLYRS
jgi:hypothetical protein